MPPRNIPADALDKDFLSELARGAQKTFENAEELFKEACLLKENGALSRVLFLHQISLEECAKVDILMGHAASLLTGNKVNVKKLSSVLRSHASKNRANAYFLPVPAKEEAAKRRGNFKGAIAVFSQIQAAFHSKSNAAKNASLYVDFRDKKFVAPSECTTPELVAEIASLNEKFLALTYPKLEILLKWDKTPEESQETTVQIEKRLKELRSELPDDPLKAFKTLIQEMLETERVKRK